jgi:Rrf2 family protein
VLTGSSLASFHALPVAGTAKVLQQLAAAGIVEGRAGRIGGYVLARPPTEITVAEIVAAVGGPAPVFRCREIRRQGANAGESAHFSARCAIARLMDDAESAWWDSLRAVTLASLCRQVNSELDKGTRDRSRSWFEAEVRVR